MKIVPRKEKNSKESSALKLKKTTTMHLEMKQKPKNEKRKII